MSVYIIEKKTKKEEKEPGPLGTNGIQSLFLYAFGYKCVCDCASLPIYAHVFVYNKASSAVL